MTRPLRRMLSVLGRERALREEIERLAGEQAALRRVSTLVAKAAAPEEIFAAVAGEVGYLLPAADFTMVGRYDADRAVEMVGGWSRTDGHMLVGRRSRLGGRNVSTQVFETGQAARVDYLADSEDAVTVTARQIGMRSTAGAPISVEGRLWGVMIAASARENAMPPGTQHRLAALTELVATAIANAEAQAELTASRARIVATADETRRRIERDLHDGAQQQLVSLALQLQAAHETVPPGLGKLRAELGRVATGLSATLDELREYARGIHPAILAEGGLAPALKTLARRSPLPVTLDVQLAGRLPERVEVTAYYVVSEALANAAKHAGASAVHVGADATGGGLGVDVVPGDEDHASAPGLLRVGAEHVGAECVAGLHDRCAGDEAGDELAGRSPVQVVGAPVVGRVDDDLVVPFEASQGVGHSVPGHSDDDDACRRSLIHRPCRHSLAERRDDGCQ